LGLKTVKKHLIGKSGLSFFIDDPKEADKLKKFLSTKLKRVRKIDLDKDKGDETNFVIAADLFEGKIKEHMAGGLTYKKGKTVTVTHKTSGKELVIIDKPSVRKEYEKIGYVAEGKLTEGGRFKLSPGSEMQWGGNKIVLMTRHGKIALDKKELKNMLKGLRMHHLADGKLNEAKETIFDVAARVVKNHQAEKWKGQMMDATSANLLVKVFKKVNPKMKKILSDLGEKNPAGLMKTLWAVVK